MQTTLSQAHYQSGFMLYMATSMLDYSLETGKLQTEVTQPPALASDTTIYMACSCE